MAPDIDALLDGLDIDVWDYLVLGHGAQFGLCFRWPGMRHAVRGKMPMNLENIERAAKSLMDWRAAKLQQEPTRV